MPPRKRARAASSATIACDRSAIVLKQSSAIGAIYEAGELCDGEVKLGQQTYKVSRMVLASASPFFKAAFSGTMREGVQQAVALDASLSATAVEALLKFAHAPGPITVPEDEVEDLLAAADILSIADAVPLIASQLGTSVTRENCLVRLGLAGRYDLDALAEAALKTIDKHFADVAASEAFRQLPAEELTRLLKADYAETQETAFYEALLAWIAHDASRAADFDSLLELVRLPDLGTAYLVANVIREDHDGVGAGAAAGSRGGAVADGAGAARCAGLARTEPRRKYLDVRFDTVAPSGVRLENDGKKVSRTSYHSWMGARASISLGALGRRATRLRHQQLEALFRKTSDSSWELPVMTMRNSGNCARRVVGNLSKVGSIITSAQRGDEFTILRTERLTLTIVGNRGESSMAFHAALWRWRGPLLQAKSGTRTCS